MAFEYRAVAWDDGDIEPELVWQGDSPDYDDARKSVMLTGGTPAFDHWRMEMRQVSDWQPLAESDARLIAASTPPAEAVSDD